ncbi:UBN2_2 domain-containing protein, partial [Cephalotus follicularis]
FEGFETAEEMWTALKDKFGGTSASKLRKLTIKFDTYRKCQNRSMSQQLREMSNLIRDLKTVEHTPTDEQQVQPVSQSFLERWEHMKINFAHNDNIKTFDDIEHHLELENECLEAAKSSSHAYAAETNSCRASGLQFLWKKKEGWAGTQES